MKKRLNNDEVVRLHIKQNFESSEEFREPLPNYNRPSLNKNEKLIKQYMGQRK